jgi:SnoaL-like domain
MTDPALQALLDKLQIAELLTRYLRSVDRGDVDTLRACYLPGATEDHGGLFAGPAQDYVDSIAAALTHPRSRTSHNLTNLLIDLDGDVATAESYCVTFARIKADGQYYHSFTGARMIDRLERRDGEPRTWGIAHRQLVWDWNHDAPEEEHWMRGLLAPDPSVLRMSAKFPADPVYAPADPGTRAQPVRNHNPPYRT